MHDQQLNTIRQLMAEYRHEEAEQILSDAIRALVSAPNRKVESAVTPDRDGRDTHDRDDHATLPDLYAELGILYCHTQREVQAVELLEKAWGGESEPRLAQMLVDHFACRRQMARKLGIRDELGERLRKQVNAATGRKPGDVGIKLSACLIVKNEEKHLDRCLASLKGLVDEIVVVDTGSTDRTVEIATKHSAVIGHFQWCDDFAAARNESLKLATGNWILWIDADEELTERSLNPIREGLIRPHFGGYYIRILNLMDDEGEANQYVHSPLRLFQNLPGIAFSGAVHEQIAPSLAPHGLPNATLENALIRHYGYRPSEMDAKSKIDRTLSLLEKQVSEEPGEAFHWFNLANAHTVASNFEEAAGAAVECIERLDDKNTFGSLTYQLLQTALIELGRPEEAIARADEAEKRGFAGILTEFERAHALSRLGRFDDALKSIDRCFELEWPSDLTGDYGIVTYKRHLLKGQILAQMGRLDEALSLLDHALSVDPTNAIATYTKGAVLEKMGKLDEALALFERVFASASQGRAARKGAARINLVTGNPGTRTHGSSGCRPERWPRIGRARPRRTKHACCKRATRPRS
jgi:tetratricopeptide (TPR) repeat protein